MRRLFLPLTFLFSAAISGCNPAAWQTANTIANGVACGMAAANATPCTSQAVLDALARDADSAKAKVEAVAPQAASADPVMAKMLMESMAANAESNRRFTEALLKLAAQSDRGPLPQYELPVVVAPPAKPTSTVAPLAPLAPPSQ